jgi:hypothetical protein
MSWTVTHPDTYWYVLGRYLGDGHITQRSANGSELRLACDQRYPGLIDEIARALEITFPESQPTRFAASTGAADVSRISHPALGVAFPQHGRDPKHERPIILSEWQSDLTHAHPAALIRGLIHTDGCLRCQSRSHDASERTHRRISPRSLLLQQRLG